MNNRGFFLNELDQEMVWHPFALPYAKNILIKKAKGVYLYGSNNKKYLDAVSSWWVNLHGHGNIRLKNAVPVGETIFLEGRIKRVEAKLVYGEAVARNAGGEVLAKADVTCIRMKASHITLAPTLKER